MKKNKIKRNMKINVKQILMINNKYQRLILIIIKVKKNNRVQVLIKNF